MNVGDRIRVVEGAKPIVYGEIGEEKDPRVYIGPGDTGTIAGANNDGGGVLVHFDKRSYSPCFYPYRHNLEPLIARPCGQCESPVGEQEEDYLCEKCRSLWTLALEI